MIGLYEKLLRTEGFLNFEAIENYIATDGTKTKVDLNTIGSALLENSSLKLKQADMKRLGINPSSSPLINLIHAKEAAKQRGPNVYIACMPKSGSSFLANSISKGLNHSFSIITSSRSKNPSHFGINPREQELCELAIVKKLITNKKDSLVAQHHTKASPYTTQILSAYNFRIIVIVRNIFDLIVSADDMWMKWDMSNPYNNGPNILPLNFNEMKLENRYKILAYSLGIWCIQFYASWMRQKKMGTTFLEVNYDTDIALDSGDKVILSEKIENFLKLTSEDSKKLNKVLTSDGFDQKLSRYNNGITKRGKKIPASIRRFLIGYAKMFSDELGTEDFQKLFGESS